MNRIEEHRIVIATDGSPAAQAALTTAANFPWPPGSQACAVIARPDWLAADTTEALEAFQATSQLAADAARAALSARWGQGEIAVVDEPACEAILARAKRFGATIIALGWRGHGTFRRLVAGSVSRAVAAAAECSVLIAREARPVGRVLVAYDGSHNSERGIDFLCSLAPASGNEVVLVNVVHPLRPPPSASLLPASARAHIQHAISDMNNEAGLKAQNQTEAAAARLRECGWNTSVALREGDPVATLLDVREELGADLMVVGARAITGIDRVLLGSVANGILNHSPVPVLISR
ncbi:MAG: universal stress protein [Rhodospirillaceae bacterium]